ncbi:MAG: MATE family efflux transporter [Puniceicoccales bacterium]|nr:MATE family efflux transporter [Puniceicoccales bacterium]
MKLTQHESGSLREIWSLSWPMILAAISNYFMTLVDHIILSKYSTDAFIAAGFSHPFYWANMRAMLAFISVTNVFIGQSYGARNYRQIGKIVWQTILISFVYYIVLIPSALNAKAFLADTIEDLGAPYLAITLLFLPFHLAGFGAIGAFFLGIGMTRIVPVVVLISNFINILLDFLLIFGLCGFPELGIRGAAYATGVSQLVAFFIFLYKFLSRPYRRRYLTHIPRISPRLIKRCLPLGIPNAISSILNSGGLAIVSQMIAKVCSSDDALAFTITNSIYLFFWFFADGLGKGVCTICSNCIGRNEMQIIYNSARSIVKLLLIFAIITGFFMIMEPRLMLHLFYQGEVTGTFFENFRWMLFVAWLGVVADAFRWMFQNVLIAADDVYFAVISNVSCFWLAAFTPIFIFVYILHWGGALFCWECFILDSCSRITSDFLRIRSATWKQKALDVARYSR